MTRYVCERCGYEKYEHDFEDSLRLFGAYSGGMGVPYGTPNYIGLNNILGNEIDELCPNCGGANSWHRIEE